MNKICLIFFVIISLSNLKAETIVVDQNQVFKNLRCLICQGQSVADSNSEFSQIIKSVVIDQIDNGKSEKEIYDFLIEKYGEWIVYKPLFNKYNFLLWTLPYLFLVLGGGFIFFYLRKSKHYKGN